MIGKYATYEEYGMLHYQGQNGYSITVPRIKIEWIPLHFGLYRSLSSDFRWS